MFLLNIYPYLYSSDHIDQPSVVKRKIGRRLAADLVPDDSIYIRENKRLTRKRPRAPSLDIDDHVDSTPSTITELAGIKRWPSELIYDQGDLGSCTANALAFCIRYLSIRNGSKPNNFTTNPDLTSPSRLYLYYNARYLVGLVKKKSIIKRDTGVSLEESVIALQRYGCCPETSTDEMECSLGPICYKGWGYSKKSFTVQPTPESYRLAFDQSYNGPDGQEPELKTPTLNPYASISQNICCVDLYAKYSTSKRSKRQKSKLAEEFKDVLSKNTPIFLGIKVNDNFDDNDQGFIKTPEKKNFSSKEAHAIAIVGYGKYNPTKPDVNYFKFINSYGCNWGDKGFGYLEEDYVTDPKFSDEAYSIDLPKVKK